MLRWKQEVDKNSDAQYVLIANKSDLKNYEVTSHEVKEFADNLGIKYYVVNSVQEESAYKVRKIIKRTIQDFHEKILFLSHSNKKIPKHVQFSHYKKKLELIDVYDTRNSSFCCYQ